MVDRVMRNSRRMAAAYIAAATVAACAGASDKKLAFGPGGGFFATAEPTSLATFPYFKDKYLKRADHKAFTVAGCWVGALRSGCGWAYGYSFSRWRAKTAIEVAEENCEGARKRYGIPGRCRLYAIGNIIVANMDDATKRCALQVYQRNIYATNRDVEAFCSTAR